MAWVAVTFFGLDAAISGGLIYGLGGALDTIFTMLMASQGGGGAAALGAILPIISGGIIGIASLSIFPIHWVLTYRPDEPMFALAMMIPWILCGFLTALIFAKSTKEGFWMIFAIGITMAVMGVGMYILITVVLPQALGPAAGALVGVIDGIFLGLTDLTPIPAILSATLEGAFIGGVFGALAGAIKYKPGEEEYDPKSKKKQKASPPKNYDAFGGSTSMPAQQTSMPTTKSAVKCKYCGANIPPGMNFCTNCGNKL
jgi:hypothetical protein